jgi:hypothetical protein
MEVLNYMKDILNKKAFLPFVLVLFSSLQYGCCSSRPADSVDGGDIFWVRSGSVNTILPDNSRDFHHKVSVHVENDDWLFSIESGESLMVVNLNSSGTRQVTTFFRDSEGRDGMIHDSNGDGFPEYRRIFQTDKSLGVTEIIDFTFKRAEKSTDGAEGVR